MLGIASTASFSHQMPTHASDSRNIPQADDLVLGKVVASNVGQWKVPLQSLHQAGDLWPCFLVPLVLQNSV